MNTTAKEKLYLGFAQNGDRKHYATNGNINLVFSTGFGRFLCGEQIAHTGEVLKGAEMCQKCQEIINSKKENHKVVFIKKYRSVLAG